MRENRRAWHYLYEPGSPPQAILPLQMPFLLMLTLAATLAAADPVFHTAVPAATKDKPQSKLWFAQGTWWAWMPQPAGSAIWRRTASGWQKQEAMENTLRTLPPQADVWAERQEVAAVLVESQRIAFVRARLGPASASYVPLGKPVVFTGRAIETATLARDGNGIWYIAYNDTRHMWVRASMDPSGERWHEAIAISQQPAADDDICAITAMPGGVGVIWSDQAHDQVLFRFHSSKQPPAQWNPVEIVEQGDRTADDHFHTALAADGTLFVATKNSLDRIGQPQLVLRVRSPRGHWSNHPYAPRTAVAEPSRPIALLAAGRLFLLHTLYRREGSQKGQSYIVMQSTATQPLQLDTVAAPLIDGGKAVNNVTAAKAPPADHAPWLVLASDEKGNIYEAEIRPR